MPRAGRATFADDGVAADVVERSGAGRARSAASVRSAAKFGPNHAAKSAAKYAVKPAAKHGVSRERTTERPLQPRRPSGTQRAGLAIPAAAPPAARIGRDYDYGPPPGYQPIVLPGESISKYQRQGLGSGSGLCRRRVQRQRSRQLRRQRRPRSLRTFPKTSQFSRRRLPSRFTNSMSMWQRRKLMKRSTAPFPAQRRK